VEQIVCERSEKYVFDEEAENLHKSFQVACLKCHHFSSLDRYAGLQVNSVLWGRAAKGKLFFITAH
jgi:hypothetical protein